MKRGIAEHPKTEDLAERLNLPVGLAVGVLEMLAHWTVKNAIRGDIGRWTDVQIARGLRCGIAADQLIPALKGAGWLDEHARYRLVVHDWHDHADESVKKTLRKRGLTFANLDDPIAPVPEQSGTVLEQSGTVLEQSRTSLDSSSAECLASGYGKGSGKGSSEKSQEHEDGSSRARARPAAETFVEFWRAYPRHTAKDTAERAWRKLTPDDALLATMLSALGRHGQSAQWLRDDSQYIPHAATWLNQRRWEDELPPGAVNARGRPLNGTLAAVRRVGERMVAEGDT